MGLDGFSGDRAGEGPAHDDDGVVCAGLCGLVAELDCLAGAGGAGACDDGDVGEVGEYFGDVGDICAGEVGEYRGEAGLKDGLVGE